MEISQCPFANLPEARAGRWGEGLTAEKMKDCRWVEPKLVARFEFVEWTGGQSPAPRQVHRDARRGGA
jgi:hypothetical protein